jgi:hypothetical protein
MKTSVLVSGIAALYFVLTVAETTRHHNEETMNATSNDDISFLTVNIIDMLPGVNVTAERKNKTSLTANITPSEDFSYLKFDVSEYTNSDAADQGESDIHPMASETDYSYLKFNANQYTESESAGSAENEVLPEASAENLSYLKFNVNDYTKADVADQFENEVLPEASEVDYSYLKFDVSKYYTPDSNNSDNTDALSQE